MFLTCLCSSTNGLKRKFLTHDKYYDKVSAQLSGKEIEILSLIFEDLSSRNEFNKLTFPDFLSFFNLTGLWGAKLFEEFDLNRSEMISFQEFLYGISRTVKANFDNKIKLLYSFFEDQDGDGIRFKDFTKMLYNYSKEELKEILVEDEVLEKSPKLNKSQSQIIEVDLPHSEHPPTSSFDLAYHYLMDNHDDGTFYEINADHLTYKVKYSNMSTLIEEFAARVYLQHGINVQASHEKLQFESFSLWIRSHKKLFKSYYSAFHTNLWECEDNCPKYLGKKIELEFWGKMQFAGKKQKVYAFQMGDAIIVCESAKKIKNPIKIICLVGLAIKELESLAIEISYTSDCYQKVILHFTHNDNLRQWMNHLKIYEHDSLHSNYFTGDVIGTGKFSIVYKCMKKSSQKVYALKEIKLNTLTPEGRKAISNESQTMKILNHPQIVKLKETIHTKNNEYIITEYIYGEDLFKYVKSRKFLNEFQSAFIIGNIIKAVIFVHGMGILHRDLKPENIMVMFKEKKSNEFFECTTPTIRKGQRIENIKIIDFGLSNHIESLKKSERRTLVVGTPNYIAPEVLLCRDPTFKSDNFAIGCILYFLLRGRLPFAEGNSEKTLKKTVRGDYEMEGEHWDRISLEAKDLLMRLLQVEPEQRISLEQAVNHEWFSAIHSITKSSTTNSVSELKEASDMPEQRKKKIFGNRKSLNIPLSEMEEDSIRKSK